MGRYLKNTQLEGGSYAIQLPIGSNSVGPDSPVDGQFRFNSSNSKIEFFLTGAWRQVAKIGQVPLVIDEFTGNNVQQTFEMSKIENNEANVYVTIGGVYQQPTTNYTVSNQFITFMSPPPAPGVNPNKIVVVHNLNSTDAA